ncbi:unnamed protein product, partial [Urochloa humidicola]
DPCCSFWLLPVFQTSNSISAAANFCCGFTTKIWKHQIQWKRIEFRRTVAEHESSPTRPFASMALQPALLALPPLCCASHAFLHPRSLRKLPPPRFSNGACSAARPLDGSGEFLGKGETLAWRTAGRRRRWLGAAGAGRGPFFGGGGRRMDKGTSRIVGNLAFAAVLTYLAVTGQLRWVLDAIVSLWLTILLDVYISCDNSSSQYCYLFWLWVHFSSLQDKIYSRAMSALKDGPQLCPYCTQPFSVQGNKFVRESARFSSGRGATATNGQVFNELFNRGMRGAAPSGTIVDVEAEVKDVE